MQIKISPLYELLILIEDKGEISIEDINHFGRNLSRGVIGKMEAMKLIKRSGMPVRYSLSETGYKFLNSILDALHKPTIHWDGKWLFVSFSIPESERAKRDKFRTFLESIGFRLFAKGLWVTPIDLKQEIDHFASLNGLAGRYILIESNDVSGLEEVSIYSIWDFDKSRKMYESFIEETASFSKKSDLFEIKKMIFKYAMILNNEPRVPIELFPKDWPKFRANVEYKKIRRLISG